MSFAATAAGTSKSERSRMGTLFREFGLGLLLFGLSYNLVFSAMPQLSSARIALLVIAFLYTRLAIDAWSDFVQAHTITVVVVLGALCYSFVLSVTSGDWGQTSRLFHFVAYSLLGSAIWVVIEQGSASAFAKRFAAVATVQSVFIFVSLFSAAYRSWLSAVLVRGGNIPLESALRPAGLTNSGGAFLSVVQALGVFAALQAATTSSGRERNGWHLAAFLCLCSALVSGRTGLMMALAFILIFALTGQGARASLFWAILIGVGLAFVLGPTIIGLLRERIPEFDFLSRWATEIFLRGHETGSWSDLKHMPVPSLSSDTFAGTGRITAAGGNASGNDSGYVQTYFALGLPMTLLFYAALFATGAALTAKSQSPATVGVLFLAMALIEVKEPFIFKYTYPFFFLTSAALSVSPVAAPWLRKKPGFTLPRQASSRTPPRPFGPYEST